MEQQQLEALIRRVADGDEEAHQALLDHIMQQPEGIRLLAYEALRDGGENTYEQLMMTIADNPDLVVRPGRRRAPLPEDADLSELHPIAQQAGQEWQSRTSWIAPPDEVVAELQGRDRNTRVAAARALGSYPHPSTVSLLTDAIQSGDLRVAASAVQALQEIGTLAVPALVELLDHQDEQVRWHAAKALSTMADERAAPALVAALEDKNYGTRWLAAEGLAQMGRPAIIPLLRQLAEEKGSAWLRQGAWHVFNKIDLTDDAARRHYRTLGGELKKASASAVPNMAREELRRLGQDA